MANDDKDGRPTPTGRRALTAPNLVAGLVVRGGALFLGAATAVVVARIFTPAVVAQVLVALSVGTVVGVIGQAGLPLAVAHRVAQARVVGAGVDGLRQDLRGAVSYLLATGVLLTLLALPPWPLDPSRLIPGEAVPVFLGAVAIGIGRAASRVLSEPARGYGQVITAGVGAEVVGPAVGLVGLGLLAAAWSGELTGSVAVWTIAAGWCAAILFALGCAPVRPALRRGPRRTAGQGFLGVAGVLAVVAVLNLGIQHAHIIIGGMILPASGAAVFAVAARLAAMAGTPLVLLTAVASPDIGVALQSGDRPRVRELERRLQSVTGALFLLGVGLAAGFVVFGEWLLATLFGDEYGTGHVVLAVLSLGPLGSLAAGVAGLCLVQAGERTRVLRDTVVGSVAALVAMTVGATLAGGLGLAIGYVGGQILVNLLLLRSCRSLLGLVPCANPWSGARAALRAIRPAGSRSGPSAP